MQPNEDTEIDRILADVMHRRDQGESLPDEQVLAENPEFANLLKPRLMQLKLIEQAQQIAAQTPFDETISHGDSNSEIDRQRNSEFQPGAQIRQYVLLQKIGSGGFGSVWKARDSKLDCDVAIKIPHKEKLSAEEIERFIREARLSARLRKHPNIVSVHEAEWDHEFAFISSDFLEGKTLGEKMTSASLTIGEVSETVAILCDALHHAHQEGVVHRDLKPDNILLDNQGIPHVTDFGLAKQTHEQIEGETGKILGTVAYMSPEQSRGDVNQVDCRSDIFSLGIILYQMLTRERPFRGDVLNTLRQIQDEDPLRPRAFDSRIPSDLETICLKCLEKEPAQRYQTMEHLQKDVERFQKNQPIVARPLSSVGKVWRWCKRHPTIPWLSLSLILVTFMTVLIAGFLLQSKVDDLQRETLDGMRRVMNFTASQAKQRIALTLDEGFEAVQSLVESKTIRESLKNWNRLDSLSRKTEVRQELKHLAKGPLNDEDFPSPLDRVQESLRNHWNENSVESSLKTFSWFVNDDEGFQVARIDPLTTLATDFSYRSYFTGLPQDSPKSVSKEDRPKPNQEWITPRLSAVFKTENGDYVIAISAPIWSQSGRLEGVTGIFVELGRLVEPPSSNEEADIKWAIYDAKPTDKDDHQVLGRLIHHTDWEGKPIVETPIHLGISNPDSKERTFVDIKDYRDPFEKDKNSTWLAIRNVDAVRDRLFIVVQIPVSTIEEPGVKFRDNLTFLGLALLAFAAAILVPVWGVILRTILKD